jgi:glycine/D-amino acid oxidase-like deaminating enzyme
VGPAPVRPVKGQTVHLRTPPDAPVAGRSVRGAGAYVVPRLDGRVVVGATVDALQRQRHPQAIAELRGKKLEDVAPQAMVETLREGGA